MKRNLDRQWRRFLVDGIGVALDRRVIWPDISLHYYLNWP